MDNDKKDTTKTNQPPTNVTISNKIHGLLGRILGLVREVEAFKKDYQQPQDALTSTATELRKIWKRLAPAHEACFQGMLMAFFAPSLPQKDCVIQY